MKWQITCANGASFTVSAPTESVAREVARKRAQKLRLRIESVNRLTEASGIYGKTTYVVVDPLVPRFKFEGLKLVKEPNVVFEGGFKRCVEYVLDGSGSLDDIRAKSGKGLLRYLTEAEKMKAYKFTGW